MNDIAELWWVVLAILCAAVLFVFAFRIWVWLSSGRRKNDFSTEPARCPLCNSFLRKGEKLVSRVYRNTEIQRPEGQRCVILGCPHCYPIAEKGITRRCPVCAKIVPANGALVARLFLRENGRRHVHITGCTVCVPACRI